VRRLLPTLLVVSLLVLRPDGVVAQRPPVTDELPAGFTDGEPVAGPDGPQGEGGPPAGSPDAIPPAAGSGERAAPVPRHFGRAPWQAVEAAAAATPRACALSDAGLTALTIAPVFKESSTALTPSTAPSPMTMSRYDEWNGVFATTSNAAANHGLYAFRTPSTPYRRAFWHPGIGIWQHDSSGVGAPFTAIERMDVRVAAADVAAGMAARYCSPSTSLIGHGPPFTDLERRRSAWAPWGYPCTACESEFQAMTSTSPWFARVTLVEGISVTGGAEERTCTLAGEAAPLRCWYVDASVGTIEGATSWATQAPLDGGSTTVAPTPIAAPFYVVDRGATEERHWLRADTGYDIDVVGVRTIGRNARPRSNQPGSGIAWASSSGLCDVARAAGACTPSVPPGLSVAPIVAPSAPRPVALDADGDGHDDVLWIAAGPPADALWLGRGDGTFTVRPANVGGDFDDVAPLDVDGDGDDDVLWYARRTGTSYLWLARGDGTWEVLRLARPAGLRPIVVDTDGDGREEVLWYGPGSLPDALWSWSGRSFTATARSISGRYLGLPADFDGDGRTDVFWYAPGPDADHLWLATGRGTHRSVPASVAGAYWPLIADLDGDRAADIFWYGPGAAPDSLWFGRRTGGFAKASATIAGGYQPILADLEGDGRTDVLWYAPGPAADRWWRWGADRTLSGASLVADGPHRALVAELGSPGADSVLWFASGPEPDAVWWR
jgi:hypothetical protein